MDRRGQRLTVVFVFGALALNYPILTLVSSDNTVFGIPVLYVYLFALWAVIIGVMAVIVEKKG